MAKSTYDFTIEYAKSDRSKCKTCKDTINKDALRLAYMIQAPNFDGKIPVWNHPKCFFAKGNHGLTDWDMLHNNNNVRPKDQGTIKELIEKHSGGAGGGEAKKRKEPETETDETAEDSSEPSKKKSKKEPEPKAKTEEELAFEKQLEDIWELKDKLKKNCKLPDLREVLEANGQSSSGGEQRLIESVADGLLFGALPKCPECKEGNIFVSESGVYKCSGYASEWSKCLYEIDDIERTKFDTSDSSNDFLLSFKTTGKKKVQLRKRIMIKKVIKTKEVSNTISEVVEESDPTSSSGDSSAKNTKLGFFKIGKATPTPLEGFTISVTKLENLSQAEAKEKITTLGGVFSTTVSVKVTHLISTPDEVAESKTKVANALKYDIPILSEKFLLESESSLKILSQLDYLIGGSEEAQREVKYQFTDPKDREKDKEKKEKEINEKKKKLVMKGRTAVDPLAGDEVVRDYHVLDRSGVLFDVVLNMADVTTGINSYYGLQLLERDDLGSVVSGAKRVSGEKYQLFRKWGRVGTTIGGKKLEPHDSCSSAITVFEKLYLDKTGNDWDNGKPGPKQPGKFFPIEIDYGGDLDLESLKTKMASSKSKLNPRVQNIVSLIFDIKLMEQSLIEMEIDLKKMPLGKLSKKHIQDGYGALKDIETILGDDSISDDRKRRELLSLTNKFYTYIPHDFGTGELKLIDTKEALKDKMKLMEALIDIEIATSILKKSDGDSEGESIIDSNYRKLKTRLRGLDKKSEKFKLFEQYVKNQAGSFKLDVEDILQVQREGEDERFESKKHLGNRKLLWHGSRLTNYVGILSQGLRIAPPEAPKSGYRFGKGVYFADLCEKSAHYCRAAGSEYILMMLCDVTLGTTKELLRDQYMEQPLPGSHSTKAMGAIAPDTEKPLVEFPGDVEEDILGGENGENKGDGMEVEVEVEEEVEESEESEEETKKGKRKTRVEKKKKKVVKKVIKKKKMEGEKKKVEDKEKGEEKERDNVVVPFGKPKNTGIVSACQHNEYIIYDVSQVRIRYLLKLRIRDK